MSVLIALALSVAVWVAVPYNNFAFNNSYICDGYLPEIVLLIIIFLVLGVNPLLRRFCPNFAFSKKNLVLISSILLFAAVLPGNGLMRFFPHSLTYDVDKIGEDPVLAKAVSESDLPPALFPDKIGVDIETPVSSQWVDELDPHATIPWRAWVAPGIAWGIVIVAFWVLMLGMASMVFPQWRNNERLPFPLLTVYNSMLDDPGGGHLIPPAFRSRLFWIGCVSVFLMHSSNGLSIFTDGSFPAFPVSWDISELFTDGVWRSAPGFLKRSRLYFLFVGLAYFMPNRYSFSVWFSVLFYGLTVMVCSQYVPQFVGTNIYDGGCGALIAIAIGILWLGRTHYMRVMRAAVRVHNPTDEDRSDALAGRMFLFGFAVMLLWFVWAGAGFMWALMLVVVAVMIMLLVSRIVAETGITYVWIIPLTASRLIGLFPQKWVSVSTAFLKESLYVIANRASAVSVAAIAMIAMGITKVSGPKTRTRISSMGILVLLLGLLVCGAVNFHMSYSLATSYDGVNNPIVGRGAHMIGLGSVTDIAVGRHIEVNTDQIRRIVLGFVFGIVLLFLCARFPQWPLHPVGIIFVHSSIGLRLVNSLFLGWLLKTVLVRYGGAKAYRAAMPLFLGVMFGEIFASAFWTLVPVIQMLLGADPSEVPRMVIFQYT